MGRRLSLPGSPAMWALGVVSAADSAVKDALVGDISVELVPFSDLKASTNKYILDLWQLEWNEFLENKLHKIFPDLRQCTILFVLRQTEKRKLIA